LPDVEKPGNLIYLTYFNAGLRVYDIKDPIQPVESGWFIPPDPTANSGPLPKDVVAQTEDCWSTPAATSTSRTRTGGCGSCAIPAPTSPHRRTADAVERARYHHDTPRGAGHARPFI
jgi:hypothetical protein